MSENSIRTEVKNEEVKIEEVKIVVDDHEIIMDSPSFNNRDDQISSKESETPQSIERECEVCFESKALKHFYKFRCGHCVCKTCYEKMMNQDLCFYCRQYICDEKALKIFINTMKIYYAVVYLDIIFSMYIYYFDITGTHNIVLSILFCIELITVKLLPFFYRKYGLEIFPTYCNIILNILRVVWMIFLFVGHITMWKVVVSNILKESLIGLIMTCEYYKNKKKSLYQLKM